MEMLKQENLSNDINILVSNIKLNMLALETLDNTYEKRIQAKINQFIGQMRYHKEQKRKKLLSQIENDRKEINNIINKLIEN